MSTRGVLPRWPRSTTSRSAAQSALGVLRRLPCALQAVLLALLHPRVARQEAGLAEWHPGAVGIGGEKRAGDAVADRARLAVMAAALDLDHRVVVALGPSDAEGHGDLVQVDGVAEVLLERSAIDDDLALTGEQPDAR